jgi:hypothetical protein
MAEARLRRRSRGFAWWGDMQLCIDDLARITGGALRLASMPPRDGELARIDRIVLSAGATSPGDVFWCLSREAGDVDLAYMRGALGVVAPGWPIEPWAGRFSLQVGDPAASLARFVRHCLGDFHEAFFAGETLHFSESKESGVKPSELKVLQLCAARGVDIYPPTCERLAIRPRERRCRRQAA